MKHVNIGCLALVSILITSCASKGPSSPQEAAGEYIFQYRSGEVEVLALHSDLNFSHELYLDKSSYQKRSSVIYTNTGTWDFAESKLSFRGWLCFNAEPKLERIYPPRPYSLWTAYWEEPANGHDARILVSSAIGYEFLRVAKAIK